MDFKEYLENLDENIRDIVDRLKEKKYQAKLVKRQNKDAGRRLKKLIQPFVLRRKKNHVLEEQFQHLQKFVIKSSPLICSFYEPRNTLKHGA